MLTGLQDMVSEERLREQGLFTLKSREG